MTKAKELKTLKMALLECLHVIEHDGMYTDSEYIEQVLRDTGTDEELINMHKKIVV